MKNNNTYHTGNLNTAKEERRFTMKGLTKKACALSLFAIMTISPLSFASADTGCAVPEAPERPQVESYLDNDKITEYNNQVDAYNQAAQNYNISVDEETGAFSFSAAEDKPFSFRNELEKLEDDPGSEGHQTGRGGTGPAGTYGKNGTARTVF